jgi:hypothetical protein
MFTPDEIIAWTPDAMRTWLRTHPSEANFNWLALGAGAAMAATSSAEVETTRRDALGEVALYAFQMATRRDEGSREGVLLSELALRAGLIQHLGAAPGTSRDQGDLLDLISREVETAEGAKDKVANGPIDLIETPRSELRKLRHVKNVLRAAELFLTERGPTLPAPISWWWSRRQQLP